MIQLQWLAHETGSEYCFNEILYLFPSPLISVFSYQATWVKVLGLQVEQQSVVKGTLEKGSVVNKDWDYLRRSLPALSWWVWGRCSLSQELLSEEERLTPSFPNPLTLLSAIRAKSLYIKATIKINQNFEPWSIHLVFTLTWKKKRKRRKKGKEKTSRSKTQHGFVIVTRDLGLGMCVE